MANGCIAARTSSLLFFLLSCLLISYALCDQGHQGRTSGAGYLEQYPHEEFPEKHVVLQESMKVLNKDKPPIYARRMLIGSIAPKCTYNECRACRFKCTAEQVPVDTNDPMNSAYHYKCVCHR